MAVKMGGGGRKRKTETDNHSKKSHIYYHQLQNFFRNTTKSG